MKFVFTTFTFLIFAFNLNAQAAIFALLFGDKVATENFNVSLEAGVASTSVSNLEYNPSRHLGLQFGIGFNIKLSEHFTLSPGAYFLSSRQVRLENAPVYQGESVQIVEEFSDVQLKFQYIDVPVKISYNFPQSEWALGLAPQISFLTNTTARYDFKNDEILTADIKDFSEKIDYGLQVFATRNFSLSGQKILILGLRYYQGFNDVVKNKTGFTKGSSSSNYIGLMASFPFIAKPTE